MDTYPIVDFLKLSCYTHFLTMHNLERVIRTGVGMVMSYGLVACTESRPVINPAYTPTPVAGGLKPDQLPGATETELTKPSFNFSETVPEGQKKEIEQATKALAWYNLKTGVTLNEVKVFADDIPGRIIEQYLQRTNFPENQKAQERQNLLRATAWAGQQSDFFIITSSAGWNSASPIIGGPAKEGRIHTTVHELFHLIQMKFNAHHRLFPYWLWEGSAHFAAAQFLKDNNIYPYENIVNGHISEASRMREQLQALETPAFYSAGTPFADEYSLAFLATQYLTSGLPDGGIKQLTAFWEQVGKGTSWQNAFQQAFNKTTQEFYTGFEAWKQQGFK